MAKAEVNLMQVITASGTVYRVNCLNRKAMRHPGDRAEGLRRDDRWMEYDRLDDPEVGDVWRLWLVNDETGLSFMRITTPVTRWVKFWDDGSITTSESNDAEESHGSEDEDPFAAVRGR